MTVKATEQRSLVEDSAENKASLNQVHIQYAKHNVKIHISKCNIGSELMQTIGAKRHTNQDISKKAQRAGETEKCY